ncbi:VOC family protein [Rhodococcus opacus]|uniref:VOC family protein n=1 Tax=Rhodococcus opacus TaxID=37919 RepID=UPI002954DBA4|nr:VOC family protein [Rhodococcus opacus]MDV7089189.1 VOC family protein [Rhodococcus opacus]
MVETWELRARFARVLAAMYGREVPAYDTLVDVAGAVNADFAARNPADAQRRGGLARITSERRGAIRLGGPTELRQAAILFAGFGMHPVGFYDLRDAPAPEPVVSTAFRPVDPIELGRNPFGMFTSMLTTADRRFFDCDRQRRLENVLAARTVFPTEVLHLAALATEEGGLTAPTAERFVALAATAFASSDTAADRSWHAELERISPVAADIGGRTSVRIVHLAPRVFDLDDLRLHSARRGLTMIDRIQGPPAWSGPDVLLRQASFRAVGEPGEVVVAESRGVVVAESRGVVVAESRGVVVAESRGIALTPDGRELYDRLADADSARWERGFPRTEAELEASGLAYFNHRRSGEEHVAEPIPYEDYLPVAVDSGPDHLPWLAETLGRPVHDPFTLYRQQQDRTRERTAS